MLTHEQKWLARIPLLQPLDREVSDQVGGIAFVLHLLPIVDHRRVVIDPLPGQDVPLIKARRVAAQVPLADDCGLVSRCLQQLREGHLRSIEHAVRVVVKPVEVVVLARQDTGPARTTDGIGNQAAIEPHPLFRDAVDVRGLQQLALFTIGGHRCGRMVIGKEKNDVGPLTGG